jgi:hypothetical protein
LTAPAPPRVGPPGPPRSRRLRHALLLIAFLAPVSIAVPLRAQVWEDYDFQDLEFRGIGIEAGPIWPAGVESTLAFGLRLDLGLISPRLRVTPTARFWGSSLEPSEVNRLAQQIILICERQGDVSCPEHLDLGEVRLSDLELAVDVHYLPFRNRVIAPFAGAGLALHLLNGRGDFIDGTFVEDLLDSIAPGLAPILGVNIHVAREFRFGAEARFMLASDVRYASIGLGGVWTLPRPGSAPDSIIREIRR